VEWSIREVARLSGVTSRTLRHYDAIGLLPAARVAGNGYRYYDRAALDRLQRILVLRSVGLPLGRLRELLDRPSSHVEALELQAALLEAEAQRVARTLAAVRHALEAARSGHESSLEMLFEGFDDAHEQEVTARWGQQAYDAAHQWWHAKTLTERAAWKASSDALVADWIAAARAGVPPDGDVARELARRHVDWLAQTPGTSGSGDAAQRAARVTALARTYVDDPRFTRTYGGDDGARLVHDALVTYVAGDQP
jgi:DNA-binding transcriptional MerR regulator